MYLCTNRTDNTDCSAIIRYRFKSTTVFLLQLRYKDREVVGELKHY